MGDRNICHLQRITSPTRPRPIMEGRPRIWERSMRSKRGIAVQSEARRHRCIAHQTSSCHCGPPSPTLGSIYFKPHSAPNLHVRHGQFTRLLLFLLRVLLRTRRGIRIRRWPSPLYLLDASPEAAETYKRFPARASDDRMPRYTDCGQWVGNQQ